MSYSCDLKEGGPPSEMAIVDTFTRLIFGEEDYSSSENLIIETLRLVDPNVALDSRSEMGQYLRALGVSEMIRLVSRVEARLIEGLQVLTSTVETAHCTTRGQRSRP